MARKLPLLWLTQQPTRHNAPVDFTAVASQLGILPDLRYVYDGLQRSRRCISDFPEELSECLRAVPGSRLEPQQLVDGIDQLLAWCNAQQWGAHDLPRLRMGRQDGNAGHPLRGHCLSVSFHWPNLFYTLEPEEAATARTASVLVPFELLMAEFSTYVIAAQSTIDPDDYILYCKKWWSSGQLPSHTAFPDRRLASRVASASRAMRRLGLQRHHALHAHLADPGKGDRFHMRVSSALRRKRKWDDGDDQLLNSIALLLEEVRPGWSRVGHARRSGGGHKQGRARKALRRNYRDGYVRVLGDAIRTTTGTDAGTAIEHTRPLPASIESLTLELVEEWKLQIEAEPDGTAAREHSVNGKRPTVALLRREAEREAEILLDGQEWLPADETGSNPGMESIVLGREIDGDEPTEAKQTSKWAIQHVRRAQFAHAIGPNRLSPADVKRLLESIRGAPPDSPNKVILVALHACLALGRPLDEIAALHIHEGMHSPKEADERVHYSIESRKWMVPCPAPAWRDKGKDPNERPQWSTLWLWDQTGFADLLRHFGLAREGHPFQKLTEGRKRAAGAFLKASLPHAGATSSQCSDFLFHRLLACSQGDLGVASLITGHEHAHSRSIRHYANYPPSHVWSAYRRAWEFAQKDSPPRQSSSATAAPSKNDRGGFGAKRVPTADFVQRLLAHLARIARHGENAAERRNAFTAYTLAGLVLALGMRPVVEPLITDIIGSSANELLPTYIDKARSDYDRRVNAIPNELAEHLYRYVTFRKQLVVTGPERVKRATFVYVDSEGLFERFRPSDFLKVVAPAFTLELYSLRRFLRTELRCTYAVHAEDVDAWMGHWFQRLSPHDRLSTYPLQRLLALGKGAISDLLESVGFHPLAPPR